jgi:dsDNA-specific endonuclease/ATPase MutS2
MNEVMARSLSPQELAEELRYHVDPGVSRLALSIISGGELSRDFEEELEDSERAAENARGEADALEQQCDDLKELLRECIEELPESAANLIARIKDAVK